jgi:hypothetical protein
MENEVVNETRTRTCHNEGCTETLSYTPGVTQITEQFAIELGQWLTVMGENLQPVNGGFAVVPGIKTFCSTQCLKEYIEGMTKEYEEAEERAVQHMQELVAGNIVELEDLDLIDKPDLEKLRAAAEGKS